MCGEVAAALSLRPRQYQVHAFGGAHRRHVSRPLAVVCCEPRARTGPSGLSPYDPTTTATSRLTKHSSTQGAAPTSSSRPLWTPEEVREATGGALRGSWIVPILGVSIDTRTLLPGDLFVALPGPVRDGAAFVSCALRLGAAGAVVTSRPDDPDLPRDAPLLTVDDARTALVSLGRAGRARSTARVIAITGSVGKTSTKDILGAVLTARGHAVHSSEGSQNNALGVPLTLARLPVDTDVALVEAGTGAPGELAPLSRQIEPHVALVTAVEAAHLAAFSTVEAIADEKAAILAGLGRSGAAALPCDGPHWDQLRRAARARETRVVSHGESSDADVVLESVQIVGSDDSCDARTEAAIRIGDATVEVVVGAPGAHLARCVAAALAALAALDKIDPPADPPDAARGLDALVAWTPPNGRGNRRRLHLSPPSSAPPFVLVDESHNACPASVRAALASLAATPPLGPGGRRIVFLGDMLELGASDERPLHAALATDVIEASVDAVHVAGPLMSSLYDALAAAVDEGRVERTWWPDAEALAGAVPGLVGPGDVAVVKGSRGSRMDRVAAALTAMRFCP